MSDRARESVLPTWEEVEREARSVLWWQCAGCGAVGQHSELIPDPEHPCGRDQCPRCHAVNIITCCYATEGGAEDGENSGVGGVVVDEALDALRPLFDRLTATLDDAEYVVVSKRRHSSPKRMIYQTKEGADRRFALLTHPRPWEALGQDPDAFACCSGIECGCGGLTVREEHESKRRSVEEQAPLEYARIDRRSTSPWVPLMSHSNPEGE